MGTKGLIHIIARNEKGEIKEYWIYNQFDSYPTGLGQDIVEFLKEKDFKELELKFASLKIVTNAILPTDKEIEKLQPYTNLNVSTQSPKEWYCLLRKTQGDLGKILECGYAEDFGKPVEKSWIHYEYTLDFVDRHFHIREFLAGNKERKFSYPLESIPETWINDVEKDL